MSHRLVHGIGWYTAPPVVVFAGAEGHRDDTHAVATEGVAQLAHHAQAVLLHGPLRGGAALPRGGALVQLGLEAVIREGGRMSRNVHITFIVAVDY